MGDLLSRPPGGRVSAVLSRYEIMEVIGRGTTSIVYRAHDTVLDRSVALKEVKFDRASDLALAEARAVARISHPNVVTVHDILIESERRMIAMELLEGPTLRVLLDTEGVLGLGRALTFGRQIASSLAAAHAAGVVHRDIKPDNIFVLLSGRVVVSDFGLSFTTLRGGTPGYMAPEQWDGDEGGPPADVFAWACVLVEALTGTPPFGISEGESCERTMAGQYRCDVGWPGLERMLAGCLAYDPARRPADGTALIHDLDRLRGLSTVPMSGPLSIVQVAPRHPRDESGAPNWRAHPRRITVHVYSPDRAEWFVTINEGTAVDIGREADITLFDPMVSRRHARMAWDHGAWIVTDLGSLNGTLLNDVRVEVAVVKPGDVLTLGSTILRIERS